MTPVPRSDEDEGVNIKDWKPDVDVTYQGEKQILLDLHGC